jgi:hypothetical protein
MSINKIRYMPGNWVFEIHTKESIDQTSPTVILLAKELEEGHNSKFPYKIEVIYYVENPNSFINRQPTFSFEENEKLLLLQHTCVNPKDELKPIIQLMKSQFHSEAYNEARAI